MADGNGNDEPDDLGDDGGGELSGNPSGEILEIHEILEWQLAVDEENAGESHNG